jgi:hypothetical protein
MSKFKNKLKKPRCVFYPKLVCNVRAEMQKESVLADIIKPDLKNLSDETQIIMKITDAVKGMYEWKWMNLSNFCQICEKKSVQDIKYQAKKLEDVPLIFVKKRTVKPPGRT